MFAAPYDVLMVVWGLIFITLWIGFIAVVNGILQREERETEQWDRSADGSSAVSQHHPLHPAA
ncbi:MAG TPA: hypothetical protein VNL16_19940 [Chloroflexota bacterium]|nr:hypothetical protein [Chloroflexota bacterium]